MAHPSTNFRRSRPFPAILPVYQHVLPNVPGKSLVALRVTFPPNGSTPPHTHAGAFVSVIVLQGSVLNKMNNDPMKIFHTGGTFHEMPGCHHTISDNASTIEVAVILATFVIDTDILKRNGVEMLVVVDEKYRKL